MDKCNMCGAAEITQHHDVEDVRYKGKVLRVGMVYSLCPACGHEFVATDQIRANDQAVVAEKRKADGLMTPEEVREAREHLDLTQERAADLFGGGRNAFSKYERGEVAQSAPMDRLIRICVAHPELLDELRDRHACYQVIRPKAKVISIEDWQPVCEPVADTVYQVSNTPERSFTVVSTQDIGYGS